jgi:hypothetical protein
MQISALNDASEALGLRCTPEVPDQLLSPAPRCSRLDLSRPEDMLRSNSINPYAKLLVQNFWWEITPV